MRSFPNFIAALLIISAVLLPADHNVQAEDTLFDNCIVECPAGTRFVNINISEQAVANANGAFRYSRDRCEAWCEPINQCITPNIPVVTQDGFKCEPLPGFSGLAPDTEVDLSFGRAWDPQQATP